MRNMEPCVFVVCHGAFSSREDGVGVFLWLPILPAWLLTLTLLYAKRLQIT